MGKFNAFLKKLFFEPVYYCAYRVVGDEDFFSLHQLTYKVIECSPSIWIADPFLFQYKDSIYLFVETMNRKKKKAYISYKTLFPVEGDLKVAFELPGHLSYPVVFQNDDDIFCVPEMTYSNTISMLRCRRFPDDWELVSVLKEGVFAPDSTLYATARGTKLFTYERNERGFSLMLHDFNIGKRQLENPTHLIDFIEGIGRPGGGVFTLDGKDYRIVQGVGDSSELRVDFYAIEYDGQHYRETKKHQITKDMICLDKKIPINGLHTFNRLGNIEVIDIISNRGFDLFRPFKIIFQRLGIFGFGNYDKKQKTITK